MAPDTTEHTPLVLVIKDQEWTARSLESILGPHGYAVVKAYTGRQGLSIAQRTIPDLVLVDLRLPDIEGLDLLRRLEHVPTIYPSTPRVLISTGPVSRAEKVEALEAGAWSIIGPPFDSNELILQFRSWIRAKRDADRARERGLVDPLTGLYNFNGLVKRIEELGADAMRSERAIALVMVGPATRSGDDETPSVSDDVTRTLAQFLTQSARLSDSIARVGESEFVVVAPGTDSEGATTLAERLLEATGGVETDLRAGVYSVQQPKGEPVPSLDLLSRVTEALRRAQGDNGTRLHAIRN